MKYCIKCGNELKDDATYCPNCGENIDNKTNYNINVKMENPTWAILSLILGLLCFSILLSIIFGCVGLSQYNNESDPSHNTNRTMCKIGIGVSIGWLLLFILIFVIFFVALAIYG